MKITINVDQRRSLMEGIEAPNSTICTDIPAANIPEATRKAILPHYDIASGMIRYSPLLSPVSIPSHYELPRPELPSVLANAGEAGIIETLNTFAGLLEQHEQDRIAKAVEIEAREAERQARAAAEEDERQARYAEIRRGIAAGEIPIIGVAWDTSTRRWIIRTEDVHVMGDETTDAAVEAFQQHQARLANAAEARKIDGNPVYGWPVTDGTIDQSSADDIPYTSRSGEKCWMATVRSEKHKTLERDFWSGRADARVIPGNLAVGDYVEGAIKDRRGRNTARFYRVLEITPERLTVRASGRPPVSPPDITKEVARLAEIRAMSEEVGA